jgi:hypothetical protein
MEKYGALNPGRMHAIEDGRHTTLVCWSVLKFYESLGSHSSALATKST